MKNIALKIEYNPKKIYYLNTNQDSEDAINLFFELFFFEIEKAVMKLNCTIKDFDSSFIDLVS